MSKEAWTAMLIQTYDLILSELKEIQIQPRSAPSLYPKAVLAVEYFRLLRGEAFHNQRPPFTKLPDNKTAYNLEDELVKELEKIRDTIDFSLGLVQYSLDEIGRAFNVPDSQS